MSLSNQPYLPFYVKDWLSNKKLKFCSPGAHGLMINLMCVMHKEKDYGRLLLKQKFKQTDKPIKNFALMMEKLFPFDQGEIERYLQELIDETVLYLDGDMLKCNRMIRDAILSEKRANSGKEGGKKTQSKKIASASANNFAKANPQAKGEANTENANENGNDTETEVENIRDHQKQEEKIEIVFNSWNAFAELNGLAKILKLTQKRKKGIQQRLQERDFDLDEIFEKIKQSDFLLGQAKNSKGWQADFDFVFCSQNNYIKILEGKYDNKYRSTFNKTSGNMQGENDGGFEYLDLS